MLEESTKLEIKTAFAAHKIDDRSISRVFTALLLKVNSETVTVGQINSTLADRSFALLMLIFAMPNLVPIPLPGISFFLGVPLIFLSIQVLLGYQSAWFPKWIANKSIKVTDIQKINDFLLPRLSKIEKLLKPRFSFLINNTTERVMAGICLLMAIMIALPIPLGNWLPSITITLFSLAILERDGVFVILGIITSILSTIFVTTLLFSATQAISFLYHATT